MTTRQDHVEKLLTLMTVSTQQTHTSDQCWANIADGEPTFVKLRVCVMFAEYV